MFRQLFVWIDRRISKFNHLSWLSFRPQLFDTFCKIMLGFTSSRVSEAFPFPPYRVSVEVKTREQVSRFGVVSRAHYHTSTTNSKTRKDPDPRTGSPKPPDRLRTLTQASQTTDNCRSCRTSRKKPWRSSASYLYWWRPALAWTWRSRWWTRWWTWWSLGWGRPKRAGLSSSHSPSLRAPGRAFLPSLVKN